MSIFCNYLQIFMNLEVLDQKHLSLHHMTFQWDIPYRLKVTDLFFIYRFISIRMVLKSCPWRRLHKSVRYIGNEKMRLPHTQNEYIVHCLLESLDDLFSHFPWKKYILWNLPIGYVSFVFSFIWMPYYRNGHLYK